MRRTADVARAFARAVNSAAVVDGVTVQRIWGSQFDPGFQKPLDFELHLIWLCLAARAIFSEQKGRDLAMQVVIETERRWRSGRVSPKPFTPSAVDTTVKKVFVSRYLQRLTGYGQGTIESNAHGLTGSFFSGAGTLLLDRFFGQIWDEAPEVETDVVVPVPANVRHATIRYLEQAGTALFFGSTFRRYLG
jgi:hypothetical protein